jgi:hemolysin activation/secretion protein
MRGYSPGSLSGESIFLASLEYRHPLIRDMGTNLWGLTLLRRLQAAVFTDVGTVGAPRNFAEVLSDVGVGLRLTHEVLGLYPLVTRLDVAWPVNVDEALRAEEQQPHFYLTAGQPF